MPPSSVPPVRALALSVGLVIVVFSATAFLVQPRDWNTSDFYSLWAGARLAGHGLYDVSQAEAVQRGVSPLVESKRFIRPPFYALALWPLGQLPFRAAYAVWSLLNLAALLTFVRVWRFQPASYMACALFLPLVWSFGIGQDAPLMLLIVAAGARFIERNREISGGALLAMCAIKPHLFLFVPVVLLAQRKGRALLGMLGAGAVLFLLSSAMLGLDWPMAFVRAAVANEASIHPRLLGIAGILARIGAPQWLSPVATVTGAAMVYRRARITAWQPSIAFAVAAGVVFAPRAMAYDATLFLPWLLLQFSPIAVATIGVALLTLITPAAIVSEVTSIAILWMGGTSRFRPASYSALQ